MTGRRSFLVPPALRLDHGVRGRATDGPCGVCDLSFGEHTAGLCAICRAAVEHHTDPDEWAQELEGRAKMARAREAAGVPLNAVDRKVLDMVAL